LGFFSPDQNFVFDKTNKIDHHESLPFREKSTDQSSSNRFETQQPIVSDPHHSDHKSVYIYMNLFSIILSECY